MAEKKLSNRQRMINMMYLVLTAMLALNVSAEVLNAFVSIDEGIRQTNVILQQKNDQSFNDFVLASNENPQKTQQWYEKAELVRNETKDLYNYIRELKIKLVQEAEGADSPAIENGVVIPSVVEALDNKDAVNHIMIGPNRKAEGLVLKNKLEAYKQFLKEKITSDENINNVVAGLLNTNTETGTRLGDGREWQDKMFEGVPLISAIALLSKIQLDLLNCESNVLTYLLMQIDAADYKFSNIDVVVKPTAFSVVKGGDFTAEVFLAAYDPSLRPTLSIGGQVLQSDATGKILFKRRNDSPGPVTINGMLHLRDTAMPVRIEYQVSEPSAVVSPSKMNVFYLGVDNPVDISVSGVPTNKIQTPHIENGKITMASPGKYVVRPDALGRCVVSVSAEIDGTVKAMGSSTFRVKKLPDPIPQLDGITGKTATRGELQASQGIRMQMPADFEFDLKYTVQSFKLAVLGGEYFTEEASSNQTFTERQRTLMNSARAGNRVVVSDIKVKGPDGLVRDLPNDIVVRVK